MQVKTCNVKLFGKYMYQRLLMHWVLLCLREMFLLKIYLGFGKTRAIAFLKDLYHSQKTLIGNIANENLGKR